MNKEQIDEIAMTVWDETTSERNSRTSRQIITEFTHALLAELEKVIEPQANALLMCLCQEAAEAIKTQSTEIEKYKALCDQMGDALELMLKEATHYGETWAKCYASDYDRVAVDSKELRFKLLAICRDKLQAIPEALEAWRNTNGRS